MGTKLLAVACGGAIGASLRYLIGILGSKTALPLSLVPNMIGCLAIGFLFTLLSPRFESTPELQLFLFTGLIGGLTTFSGYSLEATTMLHTGKTSLALSYLGLQVSLGIFLVYLGSKCAELIQG